MNIKATLRNSFPAFTHKNFRLFWSGQVLSLVGTWMQNAAINWLVYEITGDKSKIGIASAVQFLPLFLFSLYSGILVEKFPKRKVIILTQSLQLITAFILFALVYFNVAKFEYLLIILFVIGMVQALDNPARQSFVVEMVDGRDHLLNAIALNSAAFNSARLVGPTVAGLVMKGFGEKWCFFINAVSFIAVLAGLFMMKMEDRASRTEAKSFGRDMVDIWEAVKYIVRTPKLLYTFIAVSIIPTFTMNFNILLPILTKDVLRLDEAGYGSLVSAVGFGALIAALSVATKAKKESASLVQMTGAAGIAISLIILSFVQDYYLALGFLAFCGFFMIMFNTTSNSILQINSPDNMRGRIMSAYTLVFGGLVPVGALYSGFASKYLGLNWTFRLSGVIGFLGFLIIYLKRRELK